MRQKGMSPILIVLVILIVAGIGFVIWKSLSPTTSNSTPQTSDTPTASASSSPNANWKTYTNQTYKYSINYPDTLTVQSSSDDYVTFMDQSGQQAVDIALRARPENQNSTAFADYVKIAASQEIQNYTKLVSINTIQTNSGVTGYETTWTVTPLGGGSPTTSNPITYFNPNLSNNDTIQITLDEASYLDTYNQMLLTFEFTN